MHSWVLLNSSQLRKEWPGCIVKIALELSQFGAHTTAISIEHALNRFNLKLEMPTLMKQIMENL